MARIRVYRREADGEFPRICVRCGQPGGCRCAANIRLDAELGSRLHPLGVAALAPRLAHHAPVDARCCPMCQEHAGHWRNRKLYLLLGLLFWIGYVVGLVALGNELPEAAQGPLALVGVIGALIWLISAAIYSSNAIKASKSTTRGIRLVNVHKDFADEWNSM